MANATKNSVLAFDAIADARPAGVSGRSKKGSPSPRTLLPHEEPAPSSVTIQGTVERVRFANPDSGWAVVKVSPSSPPPPPVGDGHTLQSVSVVGNFPSPQRGLAYTFTVSPAHNERFGWQYQIAADRVPEMVEPSDAAGLIRMLSCEDLKHVGPIRASQIVERWGVEETVRILENEPERLSEIRGISVSRARETGQTWRDLQALRIPRDVMQSLYSYGLTRYQVQRLTAKYRADALTVVRDNPYRITEIDGFGFLTADAIAHRVGMAKDDPRRIRAAIMHVAGELLEAGHTVVPRDLVVKMVHSERVGKMQKGLGLDVPALAIDNMVGTIIREGGLVVNPVPGMDAPVALARVRETEQVVAGYLTALASRPPRVKVDPGYVSRKFGTLTEEQARGVSLAMEGRGVIVMTGGPGTGKTYTLKAMLAVLESQGIRVSLAAPTGKAARRMEEATGRRSSTLHRLLQYRPGEGFGVNEDAPIKADAVVVDEASMVDIDLMAALLRATLPDKHQVVLVGDVDQLPSVGPGAVLRDVIDSGAVPVVRLTQIMRQASGSHIVTGAHQVNRGERPESPGGRSDLKVRTYDDDVEAESIADDLVTLITKTLARAGMDPIRDVQVLCPMHRGVLGTKRLNDQIRDILNPSGEDKPELRIGRGEDATSLRLGDRVIQTRNDYQIGRFNGETGIVSSVDPDRGCVVDFGEKGRRDTAEYSKRAAFALRLAYALTIHKSQGSEWPCVVMPLHTQHTVMLARQLVYTGMTRAARWCVILGTGRAIDLAVKRNQGAGRWTALGAMLKEGNIS